MTPPAHHLPEELLLDYAAGTSAPAASLVAACHVTLCAACSAQLRDMEALGGALLEAAAGQPLRAGAMEAVLARLDEAAAPAAPPAPPVQPADCPPLPWPLLRLIDGAGGLRWDFVAPGVRGFELRELGGGGAVTRLVRLKPGLEIPLHDHGGVEYMLIFSGALDDAGTRFRRGDLCVRDKGDRHVQRVAGGEPCVALTVNLGPFVPLTWKGRVMKLIAGE
jgi:putative transcriptional regulator